MLSSFRAGEWWEYKLVPIVATFYATSLMQGASLAALWTSLLILLLALMPGAVYVSLINDFTDRAEDLAAGKLNRLAGRSPAVIFVLIALPLALGLVFVVLWRRDPLLLSCYLAAWLCFTLYSVAPFRFKTRGLVGVLADAAGAHLFPTLLAVVLAFRAAQRPLDPLWLGTVGIWAMAYGLRGILWHQLQDAENDRAAGVRTFAQLHARPRVEAVAAFGIFPVELVCLVLLLWQTGSALPGILLLLYALMVTAQVHWWAMRATIVGTPPRFTIVLHDYYGALFPVAALLASSLHHSEDLIILGFHLVLFPRRIIDTAWVLRRLLRKTRRELGDCLRGARLQRAHKK